MEKEISVLKMSVADAVPAFPRIALNRGMGVVNFGVRNDFPTEVVRINSKSAINSAIIKSTVNYVLGKGVRDTPENADLFVGVPNSGESWDDFLEPVVLDYKTFGGFYFQVIVNKGSTTVSLFHQDYTTVRIGRISPTGDALSFKIAADWKKAAGKYKAIELDSWPGMKDAEKGKAYMFHHWDYTPGLAHYSVPEYFPAIEYVKADGALGEFYNNSIDNGFTASVVIKMPSNPSEEKKAAFQAQMENAFSGAKGASSIVILWGENTEVKPDIVPFQAAANADIYNDVEGIVFQKIVSAHRLSSPTLAGVSGSGNLSGNASEIIDAYILYNYTVIEKMRRKVLDKVNLFTKINGTCELRIADLDVLAKIQESNGDAATAPATDSATAVPATLTKKPYIFKLIENLTRALNGNRTNKRRAI